LIVTLYSYRTFILEIDNGIAVSFECRKS